MKKKTLEKMPKQQLEFILWQCERHFDPVAAVAM